MAGIRRSEDDLAEAGKQFLEGVAQAGRDQNLGRSFVIRLFGVFARKCVDLDVNEGRQRDEATMARMTEFMQGMGMETVGENVGDEEAGAMFDLATRKRGTLQ
jgi:hypothetical protein